ncbi:protein WHAT'S THIS FACTOR 1 homolog, chloroplastic-like [Impatiens glandulifera]|uniref:protein WHAT'S THIS FACTOR 1 homolog, chloroplastic-like n=1 Tax=Impatiens glandulifera TaxID=253017 RepID=UPI001FB118EC|nr:protein WHAT'S THIS FACTOR 1 homolog, chloroplastic-like [Impatiens glandulifera]
MEPRLLFSSPSATSFPISLSSKSFTLQKVQVLSSLKQSFWGNRLILREPFTHFTNQTRRTVPISPIRAVVKRRKEVRLDNIIQREKKLKLVMKIRKILVSQPDRSMAIRELGRYRKILGLQRNRRIISLLRKFPAVFEIEEEGAYSLRFKLTPEAEELYLEEMKIRNEMEDVLVIKLRKLLMMSADKRILIEKIAHLKADFGLPLEFQDTICNRYPEYFKIVETGRGPALELTDWDPQLAVSMFELEEEENRIKEIESNNLIIDRQPKFNRVKLPKGLLLSKSEMRRLGVFRDIPFISPYSDFSSIKSGTNEKEKHACAVVHEILSLTVEKRTLVDHLTHFRDEFRFSQQLRGMLIRHPDMFYVSLKGERDSVFLREAYRDSQLIDKDRLLLIKEKLRSIVNVPRFPRRGVRGNEDGNDDEGESDELSDIDSAGGDEFDDLDDDVDGDFDGDVDEDFEDGWSDDEEEENVKKRTSKDVVKESRNEKLSEPVFPDGRLRERW